MNPFPLLGGLQHHEDSVLPLRVEKLLQVPQTIDQSLEVFARADTRRRRGAREL